MGLFDHEHFRGEEQLIQNRRGVLGGEAADEFETIVPKPTAGQNGQPSPGYTFTLYCINCSYQQGVSVGWTELVDLSAGAIPVDPELRQQWQMVDGKTTPPCNCAKCGARLFIYMTPDEAQKYVRTGIQMGALNQAWCAQRVQQINQAQQAYRPR